MPRTREFDEQTALEDAMQLFWQQGYQAASLNKILEATRLSRSSFYETFGSKRELLLAAIARYAGSGMCGLAEPLSDPLAARAELEQVFSNMVEAALTQPVSRGCFINNCTAELAQHDEQVLSALRNAREGMESLITQAVARGQTQGSIISRESPKSLARYLANSLSGLNLTAKTRPGKEVLEDIARLSMSVLDCEVSQQRVN